MESVYWVFTLKCNDFCDHCYNNSGPNGETVETEELLKVIPNLPDKPGRVILSGGEPTVDMLKLLAVIKGLKERYKGEVPVWIQTNGDLLNKKRMKLLLDAGVDRFDITSLDRFHQHRGSRADHLRSLFEEFGLIDGKKSEIGRTEWREKKVYAIWGANDEIWLGGNWARGRALEHDLALKDPKHNFCSLWSGAIGFLDEGSDKQEVHIQLYRLYPCCPTTKYALGDVREHKVDDILASARKDETYQKLNKGDVFSLGKDHGLTADFVKGRIEALGDVCLWCDEYFERYYSGNKGEERKSRFAGPPLSSVPRIDP